MFNELAVNHIPVFLIYINWTFPSCTSRAIKITQITRNSLNDHVRMYFYSHFTSVIKYSIYSKFTFVVLCRLRRVLSAESGICNIARQCNYAKYRSAPHNNDNNNNNNILHVSVTHISCQKISWSIKLNLILCLLILPLSIYLGHNVHVTGQIWFQVKDR